MSDEDRLFSPNECGADAAAYALGALEPAEAEAFERHLQQCVVCAEDLDAFERVAGALAVSAPQHPVPSGLRRRVMAGVRAEPRSAHPDRRRGSWFTRLIVPRAGLAGAAAATVAAIVIAIAVIAIVSLTSVRSSEVRVVAARVVGSTGSAQVRLAHGSAELVVQHFPAPPAGKIYEVWLERPGGAPAPTRVLFSVTRQGAGDIGVPGEMRGVSEILVTPEPAGGSTAPTHAPVIVARLS